MADGAVVIDTQLNNQGVNSGLQDIQDRVKKIGDKMKDVGEGMTKAVTVPLTAMGAAGIAVAVSVNKANAKIQNSLGITAEKAKELTGTAKNIYNDGFGESLEEVSDALIKARQNMQDLNEEELEKATKSAMNLATTFDSDVNEVTRAGNNLMKNFGIESGKAFDLMAHGAQNGLNFSAEMFDNLSEYAPLFSEMGYSADEYFKLLEQGSKAGVYNLDYINDVMKEFQIRVKDGGKATSDAMSQLSGSTQKVWKDFLAGNGTVKDVSNTVLTELKGMDDQVLANQIGVGLWGTKWEDLESKAMYSLIGVDGELKNVSGTMDKMNETAELSQKFKAFSREAMMALEPLGRILIDFGDRILPKVASVIKKVSDWFSNLSPNMQNIVVIVGAIAAAIGPLLVFLGSMATGVGVVVGWFAKLGPLLLGTAESAGLLSTVFTALTGPIGIIIAVIAALIAIFVALWNTNEGFRNAIITAWESIKEAAVATWDFILNSVLLPIWNSILSFAQEIFGKLQEFWNENGTQIMEAAKNVWSLISNYIQMYIGIIKGVFEAVWPIISGIVQIAWGIIKNVISTAIDVILGVIKFFAKVFTGDWQGAFDTVLQIAKDIWNGITGIFEGIDLMQIGKDIINGLIKGIGSMAKALVKTVSGIADNIKDTITSALDIHSPSRWMRNYVMGNMAKGAELGADDNKTNFIKSAEAMTSWMMPSVPDLSSVSASVAGAQSSNTSISKSTSSHTYNFERMLEGANFTVRSDNDIPQIARELGNYIKLQARGKGVVF